MTLPGWRVQAPGDLIYVREGAPMYESVTDVAIMNKPPIARVEHAELSIVVSVTERMHGSTRPLCVFLSKRMKMMWVDSYWCSRL